jgi:solute carrier family 41
MVLVVVCARKTHINPDNIATPIAASLGDITTLTVLSYFGSYFLSAHVNESWLNVVVILIFLCLAPVWMYLASREPSTRAVLEDGWSPVIFSMLISSGGGFILETAVRRFNGIAVFQPVINDKCLVETICYPISILGVGGNLVAVQASRISTYLHQHSSLGRLPNNWQMSKFSSIPRAFCSTGK